MGRSWETMEKMKKESISTTILIGFLILYVFPADATRAIESPLKDDDFFEKKIRPVLVENCFECHSDKKQESDLRLDSRQAILKGGASGPAADPDDPESSLILEVLRYGGDVEMPPDQKLDDEVIENIKTWIEKGLPWPESNGDKASMPTTMEERVRFHQRTHWAYQSLRQPAAAKPKSRWAKNQLDQLILEKLDSRNLTPSPQAPRRILIRRLYLLLVGIPPTFEEIQAAVNDPSPDWYERLVDRLMASPRYGERWGRHWLDVARYADTRGYSFQRDRNYPHAYTYRDYVIESFNNDKPYDRFILEQLAADQLDLGQDLRPLAALGFLTVGRKFNNIHDDVDDKIDVVFRGLQGLTVSCARCHDHKYDAIPTADYYSLYGVFVSSQEGPLPYIGDRDVVAAFKERKKTHDNLQNALNRFLAEQQQAITDAARIHTDYYFARAMGFVDRKELSRNGIEFPEPKPYVPRIERAWRDYIRRNAKPEHPLWGPWKQLMSLPDGPGFAAAAQSRIEAWKSQSTKFNPLIVTALTKEPPQNRIQVARVYGQVVRKMYQAWKKAGANDRALARMSDPERQIGIILFTDQTPTEIKTQQIVGYLSESKREKYRRMKQDMEAEKKRLPKEPDRAMVVADIPNPVQPFVFIRGQIGRRGKNVPRQFLEVLTRGPRQPFTKGSGRLEIAQQIIDPRNPLTARVMANRIWMHLMGKSLVDTPSDFGTRCPAPVQLDVLDFLAGRLIDSNWSIKSLQRTILLSATFRQSSDYRQQPNSIDVNNEFYWRANRQRLEFEPLRDSMLFVSGELDLTMGGKSVEITKAPFAKRRAVYGYIDRQDLPNLLRAFDFASPDQSTAKRAETTVPQQLLFLMNSPFVLERATRIAIEPSKEARPELVAQRLYRRILARDPEEKESRIAADYLRAENGTKEAIRNLAQILLLTNEFSFID